MPSKIPYCDETINPITGCSHASAGCDHCYAERMAWRLSHIGATKERYASVVDKNGWTGKLNFVPSELEKPYKWKSPRRIFLGSMADIFHDDIDVNWQLQILDCISQNPQHIFLLLTKRAENMFNFFDKWVDKSEWCYLKNIWMGVTCENQEMADLRIPYLLDLPMHPDAKRWVSCEPLLGAIDLTSILMDTSGYRNALTGDESSPWGNQEKSKIDWVALGGENGSHSRYMQPDWALSVYQQCKDAGTPFFWKGYGSHNPCVSCVAGINMEKSQELPL